MGMSNFIKTMRLIRYGKQYEVGLAAGIVLFLLGAASMVLMLMTEEGTSDGTEFIAANIMMLSAITFLSPLSTMMYKGIIRSSPVDRYLQTAFFPLYFGAAWIIIMIIVTICGAAFSAVNPYAPNAAANMMIFGAIFFGIISQVTYFGRKCPGEACLYLFAAEFLYQCAADKILPVWADGIYNTYGLIGAAITSALICAAAGFVQYLSVLLLYKKSYPKMYMKISQDN